MLGRRNRKIYAAPAPFLVLPYIYDITKVESRAVDPHSFYADPEPAVFLNADPDPGLGPA